ncbi:MAG: hypothetical protein AAFU71_06945 [Cyanobacteria bacterium J06632_22]
MARYRLSAVGPTIALGLTLLGLGGCFLRPDSSTESTPESITTAPLSGDSQLVENTTENLRITIPNTWETVDLLRPDADIYVADQDAALYVLVLADDKDTLVGDFSLEDNSSQYRRVLARQLNEPVQTATSVTKVNGKDAVQYEIRGQVDGTAVVYLHTTVRGDENYYQVVGWTRADEFNNRRDELQEVITSFRGV